MKKEINLCEGKLLPSLIKFTFPILMALLLQIAYGAVDLLIVGQFASVADVSGVTIGSQLMNTVVSICTGLSMGTTILLGQNIGSGQKEKAGRTVGTSLAFFGAIAIFTTLVLILLNGTLVKVMKTPAEAIAMTASYLFCASIGTVFIVAYNLLGSIFRGIGDSKTPLYAVAIACVVNIIGDLILVAGFNMGATGAAVATAVAQGVSVVLSLVIIKSKKLPFTFSKKDICFDFDVIKKILTLGIPIALQSLLVNISFLAVTAIINVISLVASAAVGVCEKLIGFVMLVPMSFMQALSAFVAQNSSAGNHDRAKQSLKYSVYLSLTFGVVLAYFSVFHGEILIRIFNSDPETVAAAALYLKAYAFDIVMVCILFCMTGYFNGCGKTSFVMIQATFGAFCIRIPMALILSKLPNTNLFLVGLATPSATFIQIIMYFIYYINYQKKLKQGLGTHC